MGRVLKKKGERGTATSYVSRKQALKKLQLSLKDFRRLCILKGIYPAEPKHKKKANKNNSTNKTYYYLKDIQFLLHEPVIEKFRAFKVFMKRLKKAIGKKDQETSQRIQNNPPSYTLDHIVKERYPTFTDALRDLDDALSMCYLFSTIPKIQNVNVELIQLCKKLTVEFMHYIIQTRSLKKVFISVKGFYYQAEIMGQQITWIVPHALGFARPSDVDFKIMVTFTDFYSTMLGFVNFKLYHSLNLMYPPRVSVEVPKDNLCQGENLDEELVLSLNLPLKKAFEDNTAVEMEGDEFPELEDSAIAQHKEEEKEKQRLKKLFEGCKVFINREVPLESLMFVLRSFGADVSYDKTLAVGATYEEAEETITHQIVDRTILPNQYMNRFYILPQWVFDCVNSKCLLPVEKYFPGETLPPHLSPFVEGDDNPYNQMVEMQKSRAGNWEDEVTNSEGDELSCDSDREDKLKSEKQLNRKRKFNEMFEGKPQKMRVSPGAPVKEEKVLDKMKEQAEEKRLAVMMMSKKRKHLYDKIIFGQKRKKREALKLQEKADLYRQEQKQRNKAAKNVHK